MQSFAIHMHKKSLDTQLTPVQTIGADLMERRVARRFSRKEASSDFSSQFRAVKYETNPYKSAGTLWPSNSANNLAFVFARCINEKLGIGNPSCCFWNCPTHLNGNLWKPWLRHCMGIAGIAWRNDHRQMILQTCWRIRSVVLSRHPGLRYWWANRLLQWKNWNTRWDGSKTTNPVMRQVWLLN